MRAVAWASEYVGRGRRRAGGCTVAARRLPVVRTLLVACESDERAGLARMARPTPTSLAFACDIDPAGPFRVTRGRGARVQRHLLRSLA